MSTITHSQTDFFNMHLDTPIAPPKERADREALKPGTCVKSGDLKLLGRVHTNDAAGCIVIGHGWNKDMASESFVWRGSKQEFNDTFRID